MEPPRVTTKPTPTLRLTRCDSRWDFKISQAIVQGVAVFLSAFLRTEVCASSLCQGRPTIPFRQRQKTQVPTFFFIIESTGILRPLLSPDTHLGRYKASATRRPGDAGGRYGWCWDVMVEGMHALASQLASRVFCNSKLRSMGD